MSRTLIVALIGLLLGASVAEAQDKSNRPGRQDRPGANRPGGGSGGPGYGGRPGQGGPGQSGRPGRPETRPPNQRPPHDRPSHQRPPHHRPPHHRPPQHRPPHHRPPHHRPPHGGGYWHRPPVYAPGWRYPRGYAYRHWTAGLILPAIFLGSVYWYNDYGTLGLYPPPPDYRWIRYGPDLLLVDTRNGRIREVYYGVFR